MGQGVGIRRRERKPEVETQIHLKEEKMRKELVRIGEEDPMSDGNGRSQIQRWQSGGSGRVVFTRFPESEQKNGRDGDTEEWA
jgi:hypothetical protein